MKELYTKILYLFAIKLYLNQKFIFFQLKADLPLQSLNYCTGLSSQKSLKVSTLRPADTENEQYPTPSYVVASILALLTFDTQGQHISNNVFDTPFYVQGFSFTLQRPNIFQSLLQQLTINFPFDSESGTSNNTKLICDWKSSQQIVLETQNISPIKVTKHNMDLFIICQNVQSIINLRKHASIQISNRYDKIKQKSQKKNISIHNEFNDLYYSLTAKSHKFKPKQDISIFLIYNLLYRHIQNMISEQTKTEYQRALSTSIKIYQESQVNQENTRTVIFVGFPYDEGTKRNGGRVGGAVSSKIFRQALNESDYYLKTEVQLFDAGQIEQDLILEQAHALHKEKIRKLLQMHKEKLIVSIGGSNDQSYPNVRALMETYKQIKIGVINIDAHFDVRPLNDGLAHSGSPFRQMLQDDYFKQNESIFIQFANKGNTCSNDHYKYLKQHNVDVYWMQKDIRMHKLSEKSQYRTQGGQIFQEVLNQLSKKVNKIFVSFDTDSISSKWMPGVSAPNVTGGLTNIEAIQIMKIAGKCQKLVLVDFSEMNPAVEKILSPRMLVQMFFSLVQSYGKK